MKIFFNQNLKSLFVIGLFLVYSLLSVLFGHRPGIEVNTLHFIPFLTEMLTFLPFMFILVGLIDVCVPKTMIEKHINKDSSYKGHLSMVILAMFQAGPLYGAFPVATLLWKKGASIRNIFIYLGAFTTMKLPMLTFETGFLGIKFTLLRTALSLPVFYFIAVILEKILEKTNFEVREV